MKRKTHHCRAEGCTGQVFGRMLMCKRHWSFVPKHLRAAIWETYERMYTDLDGTTVDQKAERVTAYRANVETAIAVVKRREEDAKTEGGKIKTVPRHFYGDTDTERNHA